MASSIWNKAVTIVREYVVKIESPAGHGTGFLISPQTGSPWPRSLAWVITARHVVQQANEWQQPIKITHFSSGKQMFLTPNERTINSDENKDLSIIQFSTDDPGLLKPRLPFPPMNTYYLEGVETGWLGFPVVAPSNLCFFCGHISSWLQPEEAYLVDGVAINGVSGAPAFVQNDQGEPTVIGLVTNYFPNFATGNALPGVSLVRSINPLMKYFFSVLLDQVAAAKVQNVPPDQPPKESPPKS